MNEDSRESEVGEVDEKAFDIEIITWKIPDVSRIVPFFDYGIQSPSFSFAGSIWILKVYFYGQRNFKSKGYIDVMIERLHSEIQQQEVNCKIYCKNIFHREVKPITKVFVFNSTQKKGHVTKFMKKFQDKLDKFEILPNDTFTLVCEMQDTTAVVETESVEQAARMNQMRLAISKNTGMHEIGKIYKTPYHLKTIKWTIEKALTLPSPADCQVQSPPFSFASASWTLKLYPYFRMKELNKQYLYVALKRLHSDIPEHCVSAMVCFEDPINKSLNEISRFYVFDSDHVQGDVMGFVVQEGHINGQSDTFALFCKFKTKKNAESHLNSQTTSTGADFKLGSPEVLYKNQVLQDLKELYLKQEDSDVKFKVKGQEFSAHRVILKARCPVFDSALRNDMKVKATGIIDIEDCDPNSFSDFLYFLYCGDIESLSVENVFSLYTTADKYDVQDLRLKCVEFLKENLSVDTFCDTFAFALQHSEAELLKVGTAFFTKNIQNIILTVKWQLFLAKNPKQSNELIIQAMMSDKS